MEPLKDGSDTPPAELSKLEIQSYVNRMTNWQRHQWATKGYPKTETWLEHFTGLEKNA